MKTIMIIGLDWHPDDGRATVQPGPEGLRGWRRMPFADGGRLQLDRRRPEDWDNLFYELGVLARVDSVAIGLRGVFQQDAYAALPVARAAWDRARDHRPSVTAWCDTVGLPDIVNVPGSGEFRFDFANPQHIAWGWERYLRPFFDHFGTAALTRSTTGKVLVPWWGIHDVGHGFANRQQAQRLLDHVDRMVADLGLGGADHLVDKTWLEHCPGLRVHAVHDWFEPWGTPPRASSVRTHAGVTTGMAVPSFYDLIEPDGTAATLERTLAGMAAHVPSLDYLLLEGGTDFTESAEFMRDAAGNADKLQALGRLKGVAPPAPQPPVTPQPKGEHMIALSPVTDVAFYEDLVPGDAPGTLALIVGTATEADKDVPGYAPRLRKMFSLQADGTDGFRFYDPTAGRAADGEHAGTPAAWESGRRLRDGQMLAFRTGDHVRLFWLTEGI